jgi:hypothetical protein
MEEDDAEEDIGFSSEYVEIGINVSYELMERRELRQRLIKTLIHVIYTNTRDLDYSVETTSIHQHHGAVQGSLGQGRAVQCRICRVV